MRYVFMIIFAFHCLSLVFLLAYCYRYNRKKLFSSLIVHVFIAAFLLLLIFASDLIEKIIIFLIYAAIILSVFFCSLLRMHRCLMGILARRRVKGLRKLYSDIKSGNKHYVRNRYPYISKDSFHNEKQNSIDAVRFYESELNLVQRLKKCF